MQNTLKLLMILGLAAVSAFGSTITFFTPIGATVTDGPVSATAEFTTGSNSLFISLTNTLANINSVGQALSDLAWTFDGTLVGTSMSASSGNLISIAADGTYTSLGLDSTGWELDATGLRVCALCADVAGPSRLIVGPPDANNVYANANGSIAGNTPHNPFLKGAATFQILVPGLTADSAVTSATFSFGTKEGVNVPGVCVGDCGGGSGTAELPEPGTWLLLGSGGLLLALGRKKLIC